MANTGFKKSVLLNKFKSMTYINSAPVFEPRKNREACEDYTEVFLCHARLWAFADRYDICSLRRLCLQKLQRTLAEFTLYKERHRDIVELLRYSYSNSPDRTDQQDDLRSLITHYAACFVEDLSHSNEFKSLVEEIGSLARDLIEKMLDRLD